MKIVGSACRSLKLSNLDKRFSSSTRILGRSLPRRSRGRVASGRVIPRGWGRDSTSSELAWGGCPYWHAKAAGGGQSCCVDGVLSKLALTEIPAVQKIVAEENAKLPLYLPPLSMTVGFSDTLPENKRPLIFNLSRRIRWDLHDQLLPLRESIHDAVFIWVTAGSAAWVCATAHIHEYPNMKNTST